MQVCCILDFRICFILFRVLGVGYKQYLAECRPVYGKVYFVLCWQTDRSYVEGVDPRHEKFYSKSLPERIYTTRFESFFFVFWVSGFWFFYFLALCSLYFWFVFVFCLIDRLSPLSKDYLRYADCFKEIAMTTCLSTLRRFQSISNGGSLTHATGISSDGTEDNEWNLRKFCW